MEQDPKSRPPRLLGTSTGRDRAIGPSNGCQPCIPGSSVAGEGPRGPPSAAPPPRPWCGGSAVYKYQPGFIEATCSEPAPPSAKASATYDSLSLSTIDRPASQHHGTLLTADRPECICRTDPGCRLVESMLRVWTRLSAWGGTRESH